MLDFFCGLDHFPEFFDILGQSFLLALVHSEKKYEKRKIPNSMPIVTYPSNKFYWI